MQKDKIAQSGEVIEQKDMDAGTKEDCEKNNNEDLLETGQNQKILLEQRWQKMLQEYPVLNSYSDGNEITSVQIELKDIRLLPNKYRGVMHNSFLLHGFFNYHYLVLGKMGEHWFIGVPGVYQNQEHAMAAMFGFPEFLPQDSDRNSRGIMQGCWYRMLK